MLSNAGVTEKWCDILAELGSIPAERVRREPEPGRATLNDLLTTNSNGGFCELVDGILVEKAMGWRESVIAMMLARLIGNYVAEKNLGIVSGPDGFLQILTSIVRSPDVAFISWDRLPGGKIPEESVPAVVPDLVVEVISVSNTLAEMSRKRREYFHAGARLLWMVDPRERTVAVYTTINDYEILGEDQSLGGGEVLPGLVVNLAEVFGELDRQAPIVK